MPQVRTCGCDLCRVAIGGADGGVVFSSAGGRSVAIGVGLPHAATLLIVGLEAEGRLGEGVGFDGMSDAAGRRSEALLVAGPMLVCGEKWGVGRHRPIGWLFILRRPGAEREKPTLVGLLWPMMAGSIVGGRALI